MRKDIMDTVGTVASVVFLCGLATLTADTPDDESKNANEQKPVEPEVKKEVKPEPEIRYMAFIPVITPVTSKRDVIKAIFNSDMWDFRKEEAMQVINGIKPEYYDLAIEIIESNEYDGDKVNWLEKLVNQ